MTSGLVCAVWLCSWLHSAHGNVVEVPDYGDKTSGCCKQTMQCKSLSLSECEVNNCGCLVTTMDFGVAALGESRESGLKDLGASLAASTNLIAVAGQTGGAWITKGSSIFDVAYDPSVKYLFRDPNVPYSAATASDDLVCFAVQNRVRCHGLSPDPDESGNFWRDFFNLELPAKWANRWGRRNFLINEHLHNKVCQREIWYSGRDSPYEVICHVTRCSISIDPLHARLAVTSIENYHCQSRQE